MYSKIFTKRIEDLCHRHTFTLDQFLDKCGSERPAVRELLAGKCADPEIQTLHRIAGAFHMTLAEFLDFPELNDYDPDSEDNRMSIYVSGHTVTRNEGVLQ